MAHPLTIPKSRTAYDRLGAAIQQRQWNEGRSAISRMVDMWENKIPPEFEQFFPRAEPKTVVGLIRLAWDDLATAIGRIPNLRGEPHNLTDTESRRVGLLERIGHSYIMDAEPSGPEFLREVAWWMVGAYRAVALVRPDPETGAPIFTTRDPRQAYPRAARSVGNTIIELEDIVFEYELDADTMELMGLDAGTDTSSDADFVSRSKEKRTGRVRELIDRTHWILTSSGGSTIISEHNLGICPAHVFQSFSPGSRYGSSQFAGQIPLVVWISRMIAQKIRGVDRMIHPPLWAKGHEGTIEIGPDVINKLSSDGEMGYLAPPPTVQVDRDIQMLHQFSRILNRNPEVRQGEVESQGVYTSSRTLETLADAVDTTISNNWDRMGAGLRHLLKVGYIMDETNRPDESISISGIVGRSSYRDTYKPSRDINGRHSINIDYGFGVGGYQGFLMHLQAFQARTMPKRRAMEAMPGGGDVDADLRAMELEALDDAGLAAIAAQAQAGQLDLVLWSKIRDEVAREGKPLAEVVMDYQEELQAQAAQATAQGGAEALTTPGEGEGEAPALPGIPPSVLIGA